MTNENQSNLEGLRESFLKNDDSNTFSENIGSSKSLIISGADAIRDALLKNNVEVLFGYPGGAIMPFYDSLYGYEDKVNHILVRHEQGATHMAEGYYRASGKIGVCIATSGPGATNLVTGLADALMDSVPMVCITGQVPSALIGTDAFQETDVISVTIPVTKWNYQVIDAREIQSAIDKAFKIAVSDRPGPVLIDITKDAQVQKFTKKEEKSLSKFYYKKPRATDESVSKAVKLLNEAKKPLMLVGHGVLISKASEIVKKIAERCNIPVASTIHGLSAFPSDHTQFVGMLGMHGNYAPNILTNEADVIFAVGMRFDDRVTGTVDSYARQAKIIHCELDPAEADKIVNADVVLLGDAKESLERMLPSLDEKEHKQWFSRFDELLKEEKAKVINEAIDPKDEGLRMSEVIYRLSECTNGEALLVADVGQHQMIAARYYQFKKARSFMSSGGLGTMGFALPAAIGAKVAAKHREVIAIIGDGGFQMTLQELGTIAQENLSVKIIILNNSYLGMVRQWQELFFEKRYSFVDMESPDFVKLADAYGIPGKSISERKDLVVSLRELYESDGPYLLEVKVEQEDNVFPMITSGTGVGDMRLE